jgi:tRNA threonylcarbamoyladenosine biosynthesis protein TsaB
MITLSLRTDNPEAEVGVYDNEKQLNYITWQAHKELSVTLNAKIDEILSKLSKEIKDIEAIVAYKGPGSFTGLRIGLSVANALSYSLKIPIVSADGKNWIASGIKRLQNGENEKIAVPEYGSPAYTTTPKK